jgi:hypothetical protein
MESLISGILTVAGGYVLAFFGVVNTCPNWTAKQCYLAAGVITASPVIYLTLYAMLS